MSLTEINGQFFSRSVIINYLMVFTLSAQCGITVNELKKYTHTYSLTHSLCLSVNIKIDKVTKINDFRFISVLNTKQSINSFFMD